MKFVNIYIWKYSKLLHHWNNISHLIKVSPARRILPAFVRFFSSNIIFFFNFVICLEWFLMNIHTKIDRSVGCSQKSLIFSIKKWNIVQTFVLKRLHNLRAMNDDEYLKKLHLGFQIYFWWNFIKKIFVA